MKTPKEIKEFLNNKVLANITGNTPKVETILIDDFLEWFVSGVLIPNEFYYSQDGKYSWVIQFKGFREKAFFPISYYYMLKIHDNDINSNFSCANNSWIKATPAQKQQLIDKVQEETGKVWNENTKMFEDKPKEENQDIITFEGKEYKFIESTLGYCCKNCALGELSNCPLFPGICSSDNRRDRREGYFKLI